MSGGPDAPDVPDAPPVAVGAVELAAELARLCPEHGIDLAGAATLPAALPHGERYTAWLATDRHGGLDYVTRDPAGRLDPTRDSEGMSEGWRRRFRVGGRRRGRRAP